MRMSLDKSNKYDRQLRLWASTGQSSLEQTHVCLVNATSTGSEILKNLILPGIGSFTIIDDKRVTLQDTQNNFFLTKELVGEYRSAEMCKYLCELNTDTKGDFVTSLIESIHSSFWDRFNVVLVSDYISTRNLDILRSTLWEKGINLLIVNTIGYYGSVHLITNEVTVVETHGNKLYDLRIDKPWPELLEYANSFDLDTLDDTDHAHVPAVVIFIHALKKWRSSTGLEIPQTLAQKAEFKKLIQSMSRNINFETNFIEAIETIRRAYKKTEVPSYLYGLFEHETAINQSTPFFWILIKALKVYVNEYNAIPIAGSLPDMASDTKNYIRLQTLYRQKAEADKQEFKGIISQIKARAQLEDSLTREETEMVNVFCKNIQTLHVANGSANIFSDEILKMLVAGTASEYDDETHNTLAIYYGFYVFHAFVDKFAMVPSVADQEEFIALFKSMFKVKDVLESILLTFLEMLSHNVTDYHNLSSFIGGIASQEVLKLSTSQYIPLDNMLVFDGIRSITARYKIK